MSNRERWIIYPLLFLALGASIRTHVFPSFDRLFTGDLQADDIQVSNRVKCDTLEVTKSILLRGDDGQARIVISDASNRSGQIHILGRDGKSIIAMGASKETGAGQIHILGQDGTSAIALGTNEATGSGVIDVLNSESQLRVRITSLQGGGTIATFGAEERPLVFVQHNGQGSGTVIRYDSQGHQFGMLGLRIPDPPPQEIPVDPATTNDGSASDTETTAQPVASDEPGEASEQPTSDEPDAPEGE